MTAGHTSASPAHVDVLLFRIGESRYGAEAAQVRRIQTGGFRAELVDALGMPDLGGRALVFEGAGMERQLCVDDVDGVRQVPLDELRRLPPGAGTPRGVLGVWLSPEGGAPVLLIDLPLILDDPGDWNTDAA